MASYFNALYQNIPWYVFLLSFVVSILLVLFFRRERNDSMADALKKSALLEYFFLVFCSTVYCRPARDEMEYMLTPFWKYWIAFRFANMFGIWEIVMNVVLFMPVGFLAPTFLKSVRIIKNEFVRVLFFCMLCSITIELLQLVLRRGMCETDDLTHNTLGALIGYGVYRLRGTKKTEVDGKQENGVAL